MKNSLLFMVFFAFVSTVYAQESLFPQLKFQEDESEEEKAPVFVKTEEEITEEKQENIKEPENQLESETVQVNEQQIEEETEQEEGEEDQNEKVYIALNNIKTTVAAVRAVSYCSADFMVHNAFKKKNVQELSVSLKIGNTDKKFDFKNIQPKETTGKNFIMVSEDCASILRVPPVDIQKCKIKGIPDKKCKEKIEFIPIPQSNV